MNATQIADIISGMAKKGMDAATIAEVALALAKKEADQPAKAPVKMEKTEKDSTEKKGKFASRKPCIYFRQGKCQKGDACIYLHIPHNPEKVKTVMCKYGDKCYRKDTTCTFAHSDAELRCVSALDKELDIVD